MGSKKRLVLVIVLCTAGAGVGGSSLAVELLSRARVNGWERDGVAAAQAGQFDKAADLLARYVQRRPEAGLRRAWNFSHLF